MKKRNLLLVILAISLVLGMMVGCPIEEEEGQQQQQQGGPDFDDESTFFGTYTTTYLNGTTNLTETVEIDETYFKIKDNSATGADLEYLDFVISDWEEATTPNEYKNDYPYAFKFTGRITAANKKTNTYLYGSKTAPGFTNTDITSATPCWMYLYFDYVSATEIKFIRTAFSKEGTVQEGIITGNENPPQVRVYTLAD